MLGSESSLKNEFSVESSKSSMMSFVWIVDGMDVFLLFEEKKSCPCSKQGVEDM